MSGLRTVSYGGAAAERASLMRTALDGLVPLYMLRMARQGVPSEARIQECVDIITANGDDLEHSREHGSAESLNSIAEGIATLALVRPEGVNLLGGHWCRDHRVCDQVTP